MKHITGQILVHRLLLLLTIMCGVTSNAMGQLPQGCEHPIVISDTSNPAKGIASERAWLNDKVPDYLLQRQGLVGGEDGRRYDVMDITTKEGQPRTVCFDITAFFAGGRYLPMVRKRLSTEELTPFITALRSEDVRVRKDAVYRLSYVLPEATAAARTALITMFDDGDADVRFAAIDAVTQTDAALAIEALGKILHDNDQSVAAQAAQRIEKIGPAAHSAERDLLYLASSSRIRTRLAAAEALVAVGSSRPEAPAAFASALKDSNFWVRQESAYSLQRFGDQAVAVLPSLIEALADPIRLVAQEACRAVKKMTAPEAVRAYEMHREQCEQLAAINSTDLSQEAMRAGASMKR